MKKLLLLVIFLFLFLYSLSYASNGVSFQFKNSTSQKVLVFLWWLDHDWDYPGPVNLAGGEMKPGQVWPVGNNYEPGKYVIIWKSMDLEELSVMVVDGRDGLIVDELKEINK